MKNFILFILLLVLPTSGFTLSSTDRGIRTAGDIYQVAIPASAFAMTVFNRDMEGSKQFFKNFLLTEFTVHGLKHAIQERRPRHGGKSFPSGHTAIAFSGAGFIQMRYGWQYGVPAYAAACFVGYSRIKVKAHWAHDVIVGAAIGLAYSYLFTTPYVGKFHVCPVLSPGSVGISCARTF